MEIRKGSEADVHPYDLAELIYEAFKEKAEALKAGRKIAIEIIKESYVLNNCFLAFSSAGLVGVIGFATKNEKFLKFRLKSIVKQFNAIKSLFYYSVLNWKSIKLADDELMFESLAVKSTMRGKGIGAALIGRVEGHARVHGFKTMSLEVVDTNVNAIRLYERLGYRRLKEKHFGMITKRAGFESSLYMAKKIS